MIPWYFLICSWYNRANTEVGISGLVPEITDLNLRDKWSIYPWTLIYSRVIYNYDSLAELYVPETSDPVKGTYHWAYDTAVENPGEKEALQAYFQAWLKGLFKRPGCYVQATLNNIYGYFYPDETSGYTQAGYYLITDDPVVDYGFFDIEFTNNWPEMRYFLERFSECMRRLPGIGLLYSSGTWSWMLIILSVFFITRKKWSLFYITVPFIVLLMVCCASPVNGYLRYILPLMASAPWLIALFVKAESVTWFSPRIRGENQLL